MELEMSILYRLKIRASSREKICCIIEFIT